MSGGGGDGGMGFDGDGDDFGGGFDGDDGFGGGFDGDGDAGFDDPSADTPEGMVGLVAAPRR